MVSLLGELAEAVGAELRGDPGIRISGVGTLEHASPQEISFLTNPKYRHHLEGTRAGAVILTAADAPRCPVAALISDNPYLAYARVARRLFPSPVLQPGVHASASIADSARIDPGAQIGPGVVIGERSRVEVGVFIGPGSVIGDDCQIGRESRLVARVTLCDGTHIGQRGLLHPGAVLGADGFGLANDQGRWEKVPQLGRVILGDDVEIGANTTVDRGALEDTVLEDGVKLDNQIQIAHNVRVGAHTAMAACSGISGSTRIGSYCTFGGQTGLAGHLTIGDNVHFSGASLVTRSFQEPGYYSGNLPAMENSKWRRAIARIRQLDELAKRLKRLERHIDAGSDGRKKQQSQ